MMNGTRNKIAVLTFALSVALTLGSVTLADDGASTAIPDARQARLLERFSDQGIDADGDGILTRDEVRAFFADNRSNRACGRRGMHGMRGPGHDGKKGRAKGAMTRGYRLLDRLEMFSAEAPPAAFDLGRFSNADLDGDGVLSDGEWTTFASQARERILARLAKRFPDADADKNGEIDEEELVTLKAEHRQRCLTRNPDADTNGDGVLSDEEFEAFRASRAGQHCARILERHPEADLDGDGALSKEEMQAFRATHPGRAGGRHRCHHRGFGPGCGGGNEN